MEHLCVDSFKKNSLLDLLHSGHTESLTNLHFDHRARNCVVHSLGSAPGNCVEHNCRVGSDFRPFSHLSGLLRSLFAGNVL